MHMSLRVSGVVFGLVLMVAGCGDGDGGSVKDACEKGCATTAALKCTKANAATCVSDCEAAAASIPNCKAQAEALIICTGNRPASDFECDSDGDASLKDGICDPEGQAVIVCALGGS
jgi:hypothetical protein